MTERKYPLPTVDLIIETTLPDGRAGVVLIERKNPPPGWALPGGFVEYGETLEQAAIREAREETSLDVRLVQQFHTYSDPGRDPRFHTISTVFIATAAGQPQGGDDADQAGVFSRQEITFPLAFDHSQILEDYFCWRDRQQKIPGGYSSVEESEAKSPGNEEEADELKEEDLIELTRVWSLAEAEVIKSLLGSNGLMCLLKGQIVHSIYPFTLDGLGETLVLVLKKDFERAKELLEDYTTSRSDQ
ncbi:MAG: NUDIX domain-containing protein [Candidatus Saccharicenans sp.]|jgi:ADP-ribose pyrophosphatase YjhB (NUDIX family)|nr:NUDIX domain-containing protein [Candidatus Saccharicenans sp.]